MILIEIIFPKSFKRFFKFIDWCLTPTVAIFQPYRGALLKRNGLNILQTFNNKNKRTVLYLRTCRCQLVI